MTGDDAGLRFEGNAISLAQLVDMLTAETERIVIDKTGLQGLYYSRLTARCRSNCDLSTAD
jgi:uncharacterized protein (TIGR03435 family)